MLKKYSLTNKYVFFKSNIRNVSRAIFKKSFTKELCNIITFQKNDYDWGYVYIIHKKKS